MQKGISNFKIHQNLFKYWFVLCQFAMEGPVRPFEMAHVRVPQRSLFLTNKLGTTSTNTKQTLTNPVNEFFRFMVLGPLS